MILIILIIWLLIYHIDMLSALLLWKIKPNFFDVAETNGYFKRLLKKYPLGKSILLYDFTYCLQNIVIINIAMFFGVWFVFGKSFINSITLSFLFMSFAHLMGFLTNIYGLFKKDIKKK